jgi:acyl-CoA thioester hydrolase
MQTSCTVTVRSYECDSYGHVNNAVYLNYLEVARHGYLHDNGVSLPDLRASGYALVVARVAIDYRLPAVTDNVLEIRTVPLRIGRIGGVLSQSILRGTEVVAEAEVTWVCVDARGRPARLPPAFDGESLRP